MHVLFLPSWYPEANNPIRGIFFMEQARALQRAGYRAGVVAARLTKGNASRFDVYSDAGVGTVYGYCPMLPVTIHLNQLYRMTRLYVRGFERYRRRFGSPDIVHVQSAVSSGLAARIISNSIGIPYVITEHSSRFASKTIPPLHTGILKTVFAGAAHKAVVSPALGDSITDVLGDGARGWIWVPNLVDPMFSPGERHGGEQFRFFAVGALTEKKGHGDLVNAFGEAFSHRDDVELAVAGEGPMRLDLERRIEEAGLGERVELLGKLSRSEVLREMRACDAFVLPSHVETFGMVVVEAMACGKPCLATRCGGPESIVEESTGELVPAANPKELAEAMERMVDRIDSYDTDFIRRRAVERFGEEAFVGRLERMYRRALEGL